MLFCEFMSHIRWAVSSGIFEIIDEVCARICGYCSEVIIGSVTIRDPISPQGVLVLLDLVWGVCLEFFSDLN